MSKVQLIYNYKALRDGVRNVIKEVRSTLDFIERNRFIDNDDLMLRVTIAKALLTLYNALALVDRRITMYELLLKDEEVVKSVVKEED